MINEGTLNNSLTRGNKAEITHWGIPDYTAGVSVALNDTYTATCDGLYFGYASNAANTQVRVVVYDPNDNQIFYAGNRFDASNEGKKGPASFVLPIPKGYKVKLNDANGLSSSCFYPFMGVAS